MVTKPIKSVLIEFEDEAVGVLLEESSGRYKFHVVHPSLMHLNNEIFRTVQAAESAVAQSMQRQRAVAG